MGADLEIIVKAYIGENLFAALVLIVLINRIELLKSNPTPRFRGTQGR